jgi:hypothetical protein
MILSVGCGDSDSQESSMPKEFAEKLEKEHPELFIKKVGKKTEVLSGRDKRMIIRREWQKTQE